VKIPIGNCQEQTPSWFSDDRVRNELILHDLIQATADGRCPLLLTGRTDHLTGSYIGEGLDDARLDALFLAMPISWKGTLQQCVGRLHRLHDAKSVVRVYDYVDSNVPMLARMYAYRLRGYGLIGYRIRDASNETSFLQQLEHQAFKEPSINAEI
jgi:superfamily II DNA or RNA helicase